MTLDRGVSWPALLTVLLRGEHLSEQQAADALGAIMRGEATPVQVAAFLVGLRAKGETAEEIAGFVRAMLAHAERLELDGVLVDTCGTGGDRAGT
ncbi:MAG: anthranilate phosphoribosyltransferase, partial [Actinomycetota bacterium]|nr:anthranilate phosphoribosyltransferase [Actinomycetota bacterium]